MEKKYSLICVDDFSRFSWIYFLREKSNTFENFRKMHKRVCNMFNTSVCRIITDHGKEFEKSRFSKFCANIGIFHEFLAPKTPQQNGVAESMHMT